MNFHFFSNKTLLRSHFFRTNAAIVASSTPIVARVTPPARPILKASLFPSPSTSGKSGYRPILFQNTPNSLAFSREGPVRGIFTAIRSIRTTIRTTISSRSYKYSSTWKKYNKHYRNSNWDRLKGPTIFTAIFCVATTILVPYAFDYTPLALFKSRPQLLIYSIIAVNGAVFLMWRSGMFLQALSRYGLLVKDNVYSNWSLLGSAFSHQSFTHLALNMFVLHSFGSSLCGIAGAPMFLIMYLNSAVISSLVSIVVPTLTRASLAVGSLGASGAIFSVVGAFSYLIPKAPIAFFFIPIPGGAWFAFLASVAYNVTGLFFRWGAYDYAAHLGGSMAGVAYGWWLSKKIKERRRRRVTIGF